MGLKGKILKFMSDILKDGSYHKLYTQAKSTSACGLPKGFLYDQKTAGSAFGRVQKVVLGAFSSFEGSFKGGVSQNALKLSKTMVGERYMGIRRRRRAPEKF